MSRDGVLNISRYVDYCGGCTDVNLGSRHDNIRLFSRSLDDLLGLATATSGVDYHKADLPKRIIYPIDLLSSADKSQKLFMSEFLATLEGFLGFNVEWVSLEKIWNDTRPAGAHDEGMQSFMKDVSKWVQ